MIAMVLLHCFPSWWKVFKQGTEWMFPLNVSTLTALGYIGENIFSMYSNNQGTPSDTGEIRGRNLVYRFFSSRVLDISGRYNPFILTLVQMKRRNSRVTYRMQLYLPQAEGIMGFASWHLMQCLIISSSSDFKWWYIRWIRVITPYFEA